MPALLAPVCFALSLAQRQARARGYMHGVVAPWKASSKSKVAKTIFWQTDAIGLGLMVSAYTLILLPLTLVKQAGNQWVSAKILTPIFVGVLVLAAFFVWEARYARHPILPMTLLRRRSIIFGFAIALFHPMAGAIQSKCVLRPIDQPDGAATSSRGIASPLDRASSRQRGSMG